MNQHHVALILSGNRVVAIDPREDRTEEMAACYERIDELTKVLRHAQEALFWHHGEDFEMDGHKIGPLIEAVLS